MCKVLGKVLGIVALFCGLSFGQSQIDFEGDFFFLSYGGAENTCGLGCGYNRMYPTGGCAFLTHQAHWNYQSDPSVGQSVNWRFVLLHDGDSISQIRVNKGGAELDRMHLSSDFSKGDTVWIVFTINVNMLPDTGYAIKFYDFRRGTVIISKTFRVREWGTSATVRNTLQCRNITHTSGVVKYSLSGRVVPTVKGLVVKGSLVTFRRGK